jgi:ubiquinol-cytochrome c reductase cytochrome c1 subunit
VVLSLSLSLSLSLWIPFWLCHVALAHVRCCFSVFFFFFCPASIRRGYLVYKQVCATCHSLSGIAYRNLVDEVLTEKEAKEDADDAEIEDGPDDEGEMFDRPRKLTDPLPSPYPNDETARMINNGALPPDLTLMVQARVGGEDYVYSLLTGYRAPPAGVVLGENLYWNPYFAGGQIAMTMPLSEDQVEYEDGTEATVSQMAKDVSTFLAWTAQPEHDDRKLTGWKVWALLALMAGPAFYYKKLKWSTLKTRQIKYTKKK